MTLPLLTSLDTDEKRGLANRPPARSLKGALKNFGPGPSLEEIREARREMWER